MSENTYYIIGGIAIVFTIYLIFVITYASKRKKKQLEKFTNLKPLNRNEKNALVFGSANFKSSTTIISFAFALVSFMVTLCYFNVA